VDVAPDAATGWHGPRIPFRRPRAECATAAGRRVLSCGVTLELTDEQEAVVDAVIAWRDELARPYVTIGGYAGTGKTTILGPLRTRLAMAYKGARVAFCAFTGKAASVLRAKLKRHHALRREDYCGTIHGLIYEAEADELGRLATWHRRGEIPFDLIIIDEASMVGEGLWADLCAFGIPIVAIGDHGQLPPIEGTLNLVAEPELRLETIHRQAADNPIIKLSLLARTEGAIPFGTFGPGVEKLPRGDEATDLRLDQIFSAFDAETLVLCGYNRTRIALNRHIREKLGIEGEGLVPGERIICLQNNWGARQHPVFNGMLGTVVSAEPESEEGVLHWYNVVFQMDGEDRMYIGQISAHQIDRPTRVDQVDGLLPLEIGDRFDRGYALTVHKAQGSQARRVVLFEQKSRFWEGEAYRRWLYTAVTRAEEELLIVA
jgi:exodeoxyribonuclease-5